MVLLDCACGGVDGAGQSGGAGADERARLLAYSAIAHAGYILLGLAFIPYSSGKRADLNSQLSYHVG